MSRPSQLHVSAEQLEALSMRIMKQSNDRIREAREIEQTHGPGGVGAAPPSSLSASGVYRLSADGKMPLLPRREPMQSASPSFADAAEQEYAEPEIMEEQPDALLAGPQVREELRLDVDGLYPQMSASGTIIRRVSGRIDWVARLRSSGRFSWKGQIWQKQGDVQLFPYTNITVTVSRSAHNHQRRATVVFSGAGLQERVRAFRFHSVFFGQIDFEIDHTAGTIPVTTIDTGAHPNHPDSLPVERLSIDEVFRRAGLRATHPTQGRVGIDGAPEGAVWRDMELHDSMQSYWAAHTERPRGALWAFFVSGHDAGPATGGTVFEDIGADRRRGVALFSNSFASQAPPGDPQPEAWTERARFWTAVHEIGRAINLGHSWQASLQSQHTQRWIGPAPNLETRSFMSSPYAVAGGPAAFFADFEFRFSDSELLTVRHFPHCGGATGEALWFDRHGFDQALVSGDVPLRLEVRLNREAPLEFLEPVTLDLKLTNVSDQLQLLPDDLLTNSAQVTVVIRKRGSATHAFLPFLRHHRKAGNTVLRSGQSLRDSLFVAADRSGWPLAEPGHYIVQACLHLPHADVVSNVLALRIAPPGSHEEEILAQDFFSDEVGRALAFDGSRQMSKAVTILQETSLRLAARRVAAHAQIALLMPALNDCKRLDLSGDQPRIVTVKAEYEAAFTGLDTVLGDHAENAVRTLGVIDYGGYLVRYADVLEKLAMRGSSDPGVCTLKHGRKLLLAYDSPHHLIEALDQRIVTLDVDTKVA